MEFSNRSKFKIPRIGHYNGTSSSEHSSEETNSSSMPEETESLMPEDSDSSMFEEWLFMHLQQHKIHNIPKLHLLSSFTVNIL